MERVTVYDAVMRRRVVLHDRHRLATLVAVGPKSAPEPVWAKVQLGTGAYIQVPVSEVSLAEDQAPAERPAWWPEDRALTPTPAGPTVVT